MKKTIKKKVIRKFTVTHDNIVAVYKKWELDSRMGKCISVEQAKSQSLEENANKSADAFLNYLKSL